MKALFFDFIHGVCGVMTVVLATFNPVAAVLFAAAFMLYQLREEARIKDMAFKDIREWLVGFGTAAAVLIIKELIL